MAPKQTALSFHCVAQALPRFVLLYLIALCVYMANGRTVTGVDTLPARFIPLSLLKNGNFDLNIVPEMKGVATREINGQIVSDFPVGTAVLAAPFYAAAMRAGLSPEGSNLFWLEKWAAANIAAATAALFWFVLASTGALFRARLAAWLAFAFGTPLWVPSSQGLWQHATLLLFTTGALLLWPKPEPETRLSRLNYALCGLLLGLATFARPTAAVLVVAWGAAAFLRRRRFAPPLLLFLGAAVGLLPMLIYHQAYFGHPLGGGYLKLMNEGGYFSSLTPLLNIPAQLISPSRGVLIFCPFVALAALAFTSRLTAFRPPRYGPLLYALSAAALLAVIMTYRKWWTGYGYGPRYWTDVMPFLCLLALPGFTWLLSAGRPRALLAGALVAWAIAIQTIGAWRYDIGWDEAVKVDDNPMAVWRPIDNTIFYCLTGGLSHTGGVRNPAQHLLPPGLTPAANPAFARIIRSGFYPPDPSGVWSRGGYKAALHFKLPVRRGGTLLLDLLAPSPAWYPKQVTISLNGQEIGRHTFTRDSRVKSEPQRVQLPVPEDLLTGDLEILTFSDPGGTYIGSGFSLFHGFKLTAIGWND